MSDERVLTHERVLRTQAREAMKGGSLPQRRPEHMWGGPGGGAPCAVCGKAVGKEELEFELQFSSKKEDAESYHVHVRCFAAWELERGNGDSNEPLLLCGDGGGIMNRCECNGTSQGGESG